LGLSSEPGSLPCELAPRLVDVRLRSVRLADVILADAPDADVSPAAVAVVVLDVRGATADEARSHLVRESWEDRLAGVHLDLL
jgi:hypothetical protein